MTTAGRSRFLVPLPIALAASYIIWEIRHAVEGGLGFALSVAFVTAWMGAATFPVGLAYPFFSEHFLRTSLPWISIAGYAIYIGLSYLGWKFGSRKILLLLVLLLAGNVASCQINATRIQNVIGIE